METRYGVGDEVWWKSYPDIRHGKVYDIWAELGGASYGIIEPNGALVLYISECMLFPTKEELLKNL
jgi:hypothetical protein